MLIEIKKCWAGYQTPTMEDLEHCKKYAHANRCMIQLEWYKEYEGLYKRYISEDTDIEQLYKEINGLITNFTEAQVY